MLKRITLPSLIILYIGVLDGFSQNNAFHRLGIGIDAAYSISENKFTQSWNPSTSFQLTVQSPFYAGLLEGGVRYTRFNNSPGKPSYSDFHSSFIYLGWGYLFSIANNFSIGPVFRFGNTILLFDEAKIYTSPNTSFEYDFDTKEIEFSYEILWRNEFRFSEQWKTHTDLAFNHTSTNNPLQLTFITVGLSWSFNSPNWFRKVFK